MNITVLGIDLAKNVFHVHGVDNTGKTVLQKRISRDQLSAFVANRGCDVMPRKSSLA